MKILLPLLLAIAGLGAGLGAGLFFAPPNESVAKDGEKGTDPEPKKVEKGDEKQDQTADYIKLNNQFVVPLIVEGAVVSLVVLSLSLEVDPGNEEMIYSREPKIRDAFLRVLFDHANAGGFSGDFTKSTNMIVLRDSLLDIARKTLGEIVQNVLIVDLVRQDI